MSPPETRREPPLLARLLRHAGPLKHLRGYNRLTDTLVRPKGNRGIEFSVPFYGVSFDGWLDRHIDRQVYFYGAYERNEIDFVYDWVRQTNRDQVLLDIGANIGHHSLAFSRLFKQVHAFEPNPVVADEFLTRIERNNVTNIRVHRVGLWNTDATLKFHVPPIANTGLGSFKDGFHMEGEPEATVLLDVRRGDKLLAESGVVEVDVIKIDVQGAEKEVLEGLRPLIARTRPLIWMEITEPTRSDIPDINSLAELIGYTPRVEAFVKTNSKFTTRPQRRPVSAEQYTKHDGNIFLIPIG